MIQSHRLAELVELERQTEQQPERAEQGWQRLQASLAAGAPTTVEVEKSLTLPRTGLVLKLTLLGGLGALGIVVGVWVHSRQVPSSRIEAAALSSQSPTATRRGSIDGTGSESGQPLITAARHDGPLVPLVPSSRAAPGLAASLRATTPADTASSFDKELAVIKAAKTELDQGHLTQTLSLVNQHAQLYPKGVFAGEREALRVLATCQNAAPDTRQRLADAFLANHRTSPYVDRVRRVCSGGAEENRPMKTPGTGN
jgi:hypothetical protein